MAEINPLKAQFFVWMICSCCGALGAAVAQWGLRLITSRVRAYHVMGSVHCSGNKF